MTAWHVGLLRAVNVAGQNKVKMSDLSSLCASLGLEDARTLLQSGNVVFRSDARSTPALEARLEKAIEKRVGLATDMFVRTAAEWQDVVAGNPFRGEAERDPGHLLVLLLKQAPTPAAVSALQRAIVGREVVRSGGRHVYIVYPDGIGRSRLTNVVIERALGARSTGRNWNTVLKLAGAVGL